NKARVFLEDIRAHPEDEPWRVIGGMSENVFEKNSCLVDAHGNRSKMGCNRSAISLTRYPKYPGGFYLFPSGIIQLSREPTMQMLVLKRGGSGSEWDVLIVRVRYSRMLAQRRYHRDSQALAERRFSQGNQSRRADRIIV